MSQLDFTLRLDSKKIKKKAIDLDLGMYMLANKLNITYPTLNNLLKSKDISATQIGTIFKLAALLGFNTVYDILIIEGTSLPERETTFEPLPGIKPENIFRQNSASFMRLTDRED
ncbi:MAG: hypothetical protein N2645_17785 [Clostridia bacterium]|nr:hypothetical protein [Clostridia bacterium]